MTDMNGSPPSAVGDSRQHLLADEEVISITAKHTQEAEVDNADSVAVVSPSPDKADAFSFKTLSSDKKWTLALMAFANFAACTCFSLLAPFFPKEAASQGASQTVIGLIFSTFELVIFISSPVFGVFLTRIGSRFMFIAGLFVCGSCAVLFGVLGMSPPGQIYVVMCFVVRSVEALGASMFITASFAIIANEFPSHVSTVFGTLETFSGLGLMIGPPIGGAFYELGGYGLPFWVMGSLLIGCSLFTAWFLPSRPDNPRPDRGSLLTLLSSPLVLVTCLTISCCSLGLGFMDPTLSGHLGEFDMSAGLIGLVFVVAPAIYAISAPLWGHIADKKEHLAFLLAIIGDILGGLAFLLLGPSPLLPFLKHELWLDIVSLALLGIFVGCALMCGLKCLLIGAKKQGFEDNLDTYGLVSGLFNSAFCLGTFIGPTVGSYILQRDGFGWAATVTAAVFVFAGIAFIIYTVLEKTCRACRSSSQYSSSEKSSPFRSILAESSNVTYDSMGATTTVIVSSTSQDRG